LAFCRFTKSKLSFSAFDDLDSGGQADYMRKLQSESAEAIEIYAYCLMENHFHFLVRQLIENGIKTTFSRIQNAYAKYFNLKNKRSGPLFESRFKARWVENDQYFLHVSRYIHLNPCTSYVVEVEKLADYRWSSLPQYLGQSNAKVVSVDKILSIAGGVENYKKFVLDHADYQKKLGLIKHLAFE